MTDGGPAVRVGIVSYGTPALLDRCLAALPAALDGVSAEVVVWDNKPGDGSADIAARHDAEVRGVGSNVGYAVGMNGALEGTLAPVTIALNPDTAPPPGSLRDLIEVLRSHEDVAIVSPRLVMASGMTQRSAHRFPWLPRLVIIVLVPASLVPQAMRRRLLMAGVLAAPYVGPVDWSIGAVHVMRRAVVGDRPYRERWFIYVEDLDLCWRMSRRGYRTWYQGDVVIRHESSASASQVFGDDASHRWWGETYDWYELARGRVRCRMYAAVNALASVRHLLAARLRNRTTGRHWRERLRTHMTVLLRGPVGPALPPEQSGGGR